MRYDDPNGDYGRQGRQRDVVLLSQKALSLDGVSQYKEVLAAIEGNMKTDMDFSMMQKIALDYRDAFKKWSKCKCKETDLCKMVSLINESVEMN